MNEDGIFLTSNNKNVDEIFNFFMTDKEFSSQSIKLDNINLFGQFNDDSEIKVIFNYKSKQFNILYKCDGFAIELYVNNPFYDSLGDYILANLPYSILTDERKNKIKKVLDNYIIWLNKTPQGSNYPTI